MDTILIRELEVWAQVGVPEAERAKPQRLLINLELRLDWTRAAETDDLAGTIDYAAVCQLVQGMSRERSWKLIETLAAEIAAAVLDQFSPALVTVEIQKFVIPEARHVAVRTQRGRLPAGQ